MFSLKMIDLIFVNSSHETSYWCIPYRFFRCCSLSSLVEQLQPDNTSHKSITGSSDSAELWQLQAPIISLTFKSEEEMSLDSSTGKVIMDPLRTYGRFL